MVMACRQKSSWCRRRGPNSLPGGAVNKDDQRICPLGRRRLRIAFVTPLWRHGPPWPDGGIATMAGQLIDALIDRGHDVILVGAGYNGTRAHFLRTFEQAPSRRHGGPPAGEGDAARGRRLLEGL